MSYWPCQMYLIFTTLFMLFELTEHQNLPGILRPGLSTCSVAITVLGNKSGAIPAYGSEALHTWPPLAKPHSTNI